MLTVSKVLVKKTFIQPDALADGLTESRLLKTLSGFVPPRLYKQLNRELTFNNIASSVSRIRQYSEGCSTESTCYSILESRVNHYVFINHNDSR